MSCSCGRGRNHRPRAASNQFAGAALGRELASAVDGARGAGTAVALAFADLNEFKRVNDALGHDGFAPAIDDFGAGYSSLRRLRELPVQIIKVDRAFLAGVPEDPQATAVYAAILRLADACGCDVVAEGVERGEQASFLAANGCRIAQGFHFGRPVPGPEVTALLEASLAAERRR